MAAQHGQQVRTGTEYLQTQVQTVCKSCPAWQPARLHVPSGPLGGNAVWPAVPASGRVRYVRPRRELWPLTLSGPACRLPSSYIVPGRTNHAHTHMGITALHEYSQSICTEHHTLARHCSWHSPALAPSYPWTRPAAARTLLTTRPRRWNRATWLGGGLWVVALGGEWLGGWVGGQVDGQMGRASMGSSPVSSL